MSLSPVQKVRSLTEIFIAKDDGVLSGGEYQALKTIGRRADTARLTRGTVKEFVKLYKQGQSLFEADSVRTSMREDLLNAGVSRSRLGLPSAREALKRFDRLSKTQKLQRFFPDYNPAAADEYGDFAMADDHDFPWVDLRKTLSGAAKRRAIAAYNEVAARSSDNGGDKPSVSAAKKDGVTYGYILQVSGRGYGNWGHTLVYDRHFKPIGDFGWSD